MPTQGTHFDSAFGGSGSVTQDGSGILVLNGANTYSGVTTVNGGILTFANKAAKPSGSAVSAAAAGTVGLGVKSSDAAYYSASDVGDLFNTNTLSGFTLNASSGVAIDTSNAGGSFDQSVALTAARSLTKLGTGTLVLSNSNTFTGTLSVANGTLSIATINNASENGTLGNSASAVLLGSSGTTGTLEYTGATASTTRPFSAVSGGTAAFNVTNSDATLTYSEELGGSGNITLGGAGNHIVAGGIGGTVGTFTKEGAGAVTLSGLGHGAAFVINQGKVNVNSASAFGSSTSLSLANGVTLDNTSGSAVTVNNASLAKTLGSSLNFTGTQDLSLGTGSTALTANTTFDVAGGTLTLAGNVTGSFGIIKNGLGTLVLSGLTTGSFEGNSEVNAGELFLDGTSVLAGTSENTITLNTGGTLRIGATGSTGAVTVVNNGGTLITTEIQNSNQTFAAETTLNASNAKFNGVQRIGAGTIVSAASDLFGTTPGNAAAGRIVMEDGAVMRSTNAINIHANKGIRLSGDSATFDTSSGSIFINSQVTGDGKLVKTGSGGFRMLNTSNTYEGGTEIRGGTFGIYGDGSLGAAGTSVRIDGATLNSGQGTSGQTITIGSTRSIEIAKGKTNHLDATNGSTLVYDGVITEFGESGSANLQINTAGSREGTVILGGANTYTGNTMVSAGTLRIHGSTSASSNFTVESGAVLGGRGTIGGTVTLNSGATLAPGASIESLETGSNIWSGGSNYQFEFSTDGSTGTAGAQWDLLAITGNLDLTGASLENPITFQLVSMLNATDAGPLASWNPDANATWAGIITTTTGITGFSANKFTFDTDGFQNPLNGSFSLVQSGTNLDLTYTTNYVIPEPKAALLGGLGILLLFRRRR